MLRYTIKLNVEVMGVDTIVVDTPDEFEISQVVTISPKENMTIRDQNGNVVSLNPGVSMTGRVVAKE
jgi:hypothetical protein